MKYFFFILSLLPFAIFSQNINEKKIYLDSLWNETSKENHKYYRIVESYDSQKELYKIKDYYRSGVLQMEGNSLIRDALIKEGEFVFYYENGNKKNIAHYYKSRLIGKYDEWYENGLKKAEGEYFESKNGILTNYKLYQFWNSEGKQTVIDGNGYYEDITKDYSEAGNIKNGFKEGVWKGEYDKKYKYIEEYKKGEIVSGISTDEDNKEYKYDVLEIKPEPMKGVQHFYRYIIKNFKTPNEYSNIKGKILTSFIIDKDGQIVEPKIIKSLNETLDQEAIRVLTSYEKWKPAKKRGQYIRVRYNIPISVILNKN